MADPIVVTLRGGRLEMIYCDAAAGLLDELGQVTIERVSRVEPRNRDGRVSWTADMRLAGGPVLGPFPLRQDALDAERVWLAEHLGL